MGETFRVAPGSDGSSRQTDERSGLAHDFRNVLQFATSAVRTARRSLLDRSEAELAGTLKAALDAIDRANLLAHRLSSDVIGMERPQSVSIPALIHALAPVLSHALGNGIRLETRMSDDLPRVRCDRQQLENALFNLVVNARDAMPDGGTVTIDADACEAEGHGLGGACVALSVTDTGPGMMQEVADQAFLPTYTTKSSNGGTGQGLHNVRKFVESLGGTADLLAYDSAGTCIQLHLPALASAGNR